MLELLTEFGFDSSAEGSHCRIGRGRRESLAREDGRE